MANFGQIVGGALAGWGDAIAEEAKQERAEALRRLEQGELAGVVDTKQGLMSYTKGGSFSPVMVNGGQAISARDNEIKSSFTGRNGNVWALYKDGTTKDTGVPAKEDRVSQESPALVQIQDPNDPTQTIFVTKSEALGKRGPVSRSTTGERPTPNMANDRATAEYDAFEAADKENPRDKDNKGRVYNRDGSIADRTKWINNRAGRYLRYGFDLDSANVPPAGPGPKSSTPAPAPQKFVNGKVYRDKDGNKARYDNGNWIPVQ